LARLNISTKSALLTLLVMMTEEQDCAKPAWISVVRVEEDAAAAAEPLGVATAATELLLLLLPLAMMFENSTGSSVMKIRGLVLREGRTRQDHHRRD
jgi:hypothetical protein